MWSLQLLYEVRFAFACLPEDNLSGGPSFNRRCVSAKDVYRKTADRPADYDYLCLLLKSPLLLW